MDMFDSLFSFSSMLNEQVSKELCGIYADQSTVFVILDDEGNHWTSDEDTYSRIFSEQPVIDDLRTKIADGYEPVVSQIDDSCIVASQLGTDDVHCGYIFMILPGYTADTTLANMDMIELMINQVLLIAGLIDKNNKLHHLYLKQQSHTDISSAQSLN